jgi:hypothetical protein
MSDRNEVVPVAWSEAVIDAPAAQPVSGTVPDAMIHEEMIDQSPTMSPPQAVTMAQLPLPPPQETTDAASAAAETTQIQVQFPSVLPLPIVLIAPSSDRASRGASGRSHEIATIRPRW